MRAIEMEQGYMPLTFEKLDLDFEMGMRGIKLNQISVDELRYKKLLFMIDKDIFHPEFLINSINSVPQSVKFNQRYFRHDFITCDDYHTLQDNPSILRDLVFTFRVVR